MSALDVARLREEIALLQRLGRSGAAFDHALQAADEGVPAVRWYARTWLRELGSTLRPVQLNAFRLDALDRHCGGLRPPDRRPARGRAWFPAVFQGAGLVMPAGFEPGALGLVIATAGTGQIGGDLSNEARTAVSGVVELLASRGFLDRPVDITVRAPAEVVQRSLELAVVAAVITLTESLEPLDDVAFTGAVAPDGRVLPVGSVAEKRRVLDEEWPGFLLLAPPDEANERDIQPVPSLETLVNQLRGAPLGLGRSPAQGAVSLKNLRGRELYVQASRFAWAASRRRALFPDLNAEIAQLQAQLHEANNTGAQARAIRLAQALEAALIDAGEGLSPSLRGDALSALARHDSSLFRLSKALERADEALDLPLPPADRIRRLRARARIHAENLDFDAAVEDATLALDEAVSVPEERLRGLLVLGEWCRRRGDLAEASRLGQEAASMPAADPRSMEFARLLLGRVAMDEGRSGDVLRLVRHTGVEHASPGIELAELRIRALVLMGRREEAQDAHRKAQRAFYGPFRGSVVGRMLSLRQDLALARSSEEGALIRARIWRLPGFASAYWGRIPDTAKALLELTPY